ncbi:MAG: ribonuclease III [Gemmataceae bacterium]|nr:ribonuclease III [Gemmataceae bacterium]
MSLKTPLSNEAEILEECQEILGYRFNQVELLRAALTHASGVQSRQDSNERLEFLGDSILGLICCEQLYLRFPDLQEGEMTKIKSVVVSRPTCASISAEMNLGSYLFLGRGVNWSIQNIPANLLADVYESVLGAIYLDGGLGPAREFAMRHLSSLIDQVASSDMKNNAKSLLQQLAQKEYGSTPEYVLLDENGPDHSKCFKIAAVVHRRAFAGAWGKNKKDAEQRAAMNALAELKGEQVPFQND